MSRRGKPGPLIKTKVRPNEGGMIEICMSSNEKKEDNLFIKARDTGT